MGRGVPTKARPAGQGAGQVSSAEFTACMIRAISTSTPFGMPCGHDDASAVPRAMFTSAMVSPAVTSPLLSQSPTQEPVAAPIGS